MKLDLSDKSFALLGYAKNHWLSIARLCLWYNAGPTRRVRRATTSVERACDKGEEVITSGQLWNILVPDTDAVGCLYVHC